MSARPLRLDVVTIFPDYLRVLDLSLIGKAATSGLLELAVHDLRSWTHDRHRTVDDTPLGGGAGMVMKPDVWGEALDEVLGGGENGQAVADRPARQVLVIPTPSGEVFTQRVAEDLAGADQIVFACGRYEGIDARVAQHYRRAGVEVRELSIGDYVLNGGEVASLVMIEAIARLRPGCWATPSRSWRSLTPAPACWSTRSTPVRCPGEGSTWPRAGRSCWEATTPSSHANAATRPLPAPPSAALT